MVTILNVDFSPYNGHIGKKIDAYIFGTKNWGKKLLRPIYSEFYFMKIGRSRILIKYRKNKINSNEMLPILNLWILVPDTVITPLKVAVLI
jgi:hypothetical protein